jgi:hypothetical protein
MVEGLWHMWMFGCRRAKEKRLFDGTEKTTIPKINRNSFNRSFAARTRQHMGREFFLLWMPDIPLTPNQ